MPSLPATFCHRCQGICTGKCKQEAARQHDRSRNSDPFRRLYSTARWRRLRVRIKREQPLCKVCGNHATEEIDHVVPARIWCARGNDSWDQGNLQGFCSTCHHRKSARERVTYGSELTEPVRAADPDAGAGPREGVPNVTPRPGQNL
jgi:5-methylcytosine-specific restriction protein A